MQIKKNRSSSTFVTNKSEARNNFYRKGIANMNRNKFIHLITSGLFISFIASPVLSQDFSPGEFKIYVNNILKEFKVPGIAVAVVKDGKIVLTSGYGIRNVNRPEPVDENTLFGIASNTKAFTSAALAILVDEDKINWEDPVKNHVPDFEMYDPYVTREMTIADLLTHRSGLGLGAGDLLFWPRTCFSTKHIIHQLRYIKPVSSFRTKFSYNNLFYVVAGEIITAVTGNSWAKYVEEKIFKTLGMIYSNTSVTKYGNNKNIAAPHIIADGSVKAIKYQNIDNVAAAGAINSCVSDLAKWLITQLNSGVVYNNSGIQKLFHSDRTKEMWFPQTILPIRSYNDELKKIQPLFAAYGLGWILSDYQGYKMVWHTGVLLGLVSRTTLIPELNLGIVVLTNQESHSAYNSITYYILDRYLKLKKTNWIEAYKLYEKELQEEVDKNNNEQNSEKIAHTSPSLRLEKYTGKYKDIWYGEMFINMIKDKLIMKFEHSPDLIGELEHWHYNTFVVRWYDRSMKADAFVNFYLSYDGSIEYLKMRPVSPLTDTSFDFEDLLFKPEGKVKATL